jgi:hypothetical protein
MEDAVRGEVFSERLGVPLPVRGDFPVGASETQVGLDDVWGLRDGRL